MTETATLDRRTWAVTVDTAIADLTVALYDAADRLTSCQDTLHFIAGDRRRYAGRTPIWTMTNAEAELKVRAAAVADTTYRGHDAAKALAQLADAAAHRDAILDAIRNLDGGYDGWARFYLCKSDGGHIHASTGCHTLRLTTRLGWLPNLSGLTEAEAVAEHGAILCTVCFPSAPVEWTNAHDLAAEAKKAARCAGSGREPSEHRPGSRWGRCGECGRNQNLTSYGVLRAHKPA